jgi:hypothetical protein
MKERPLAAIAPLHHMVRQSRNNDASSTGHTDADNTNQRTLQEQNAW